MLRTAMGVAKKGSHSPRLTSLREASTRAPSICSVAVHDAGRPRWVTPPSSVPTIRSPVAGLSTPPATGIPSTTSPTETHHSGIPMMNSRVPSSGSTTHTRSRPEPVGAVDGLLREPTFARLDQRVPQGGVHHQVGCGHRVVALLQPRRDVAGSEGGQRRLGGVERRLDAGTVAATHYWSPVRYPSSTSRSTICWAAWSGSTSVVSITTSASVRLLVGIGDAGELLEDPGPRLGVEALAVPLLAHLERRGDVDQDEPAARLDHPTDLLAGRVVRGDRGADGDATVLGDLRGDEADAPDVEVAVLLGEPELGAEVLAHQVAVEQGDRAAADLEQLDQQGVGDGRLARAGETGEEDREPLLRPRRVGLAQLAADLGVGEPLRDLPALGQPLRAARCPRSTGCALPRAPRPPACSGPRRAGRPSS